MSTKGAILIISIFLVTDCLCIFSTGILPNLYPPLPRLASSYQGIVVDYDANARANICLDQIIQQGNKISGRFISVPLQAQTNGNPRQSSWVTFPQNRTLTGGIEVHPYLVLENLGDSGSIDINLGSGSTGSNPNLDIGLSGKLQSDGSITGDLLYFFDHQEWQMSPQKKACQVPTSSASSDFT
jgi:hypothetical protein